MRDVAAPRKAGAMSRSQTNHAAWRMVVDLKNAVSHIAMAKQDHRLGIVLTGLAALCWSSAGLFTRMIEADLMTMLFWRGLFSGAAVFAIFLILQRGRVVQQLRLLGWPAVAVALLSAMSMISGIGALRFSAVADVMLIYATVPFVTAGLAWLLIGERASRSTLVASALALLGVLVSLVGADWGGSMFGRSLAVFMTLGMAGFSVLMRRYQNLPMLPAMAASAWLASFVCYWFTSTLTVTSHDFLLVALFGVVQNAAGVAFYTLGSRRIPASEATLVAALEVPLTPFWVWLLLSETPGPATLAGGAIVLTALFWHISGEFRKPGKAVVT
jgi:drug/metabolite transporter (DMT)-like permease